ncbi:MAG: InlB B-repeat-containing protein [Eubacterium sp.]|nr:InlB B-repeat-containing protein [Candidatus Colimonas fimequi]
MLVGEPEVEGSTKEMKPSEVLDISTCGINTAVNIKASGDYYLKGESTHVRVIITPQSGGNITVHLQNGLNINCYPTSNTGASCTGIKVNEAEGATVTLMTDPDAYAQVSGYANAPGIGKNGKLTKLVFATQKPDSPGHLKVYSGTVGALHYWQNPCAIGTEVSGDGNYTFGNVEFNSGDVFAEAVRSASIGASPRNNVDGLTFNGGNITCKHYTGAGSNTAGPGIGVSEGGNMDNLVINGGVIKAYGRGADDGSWSTSPGIGAGINGHVGTVTINGGYVEAHPGESSRSGASGIGFSNTSGDGTYKFTNLIINGGHVKAYGSIDHAGIGTGNTNVVINGGTIEATGGRTAPGIEGKTVRITGGHITSTGGQNYKNFPNPEKRGGNGITSHNDLSITGGTISAAIVAAGNYDIYGGGNIKIDGGSIHATSYNKDSRNSYGDKLQRTWFHIKDKENMIVPNETIDEIRIKNLDYSYGINDVATDAEGVLYFMLPEATIVKEALIEDKGYDGAVISGELTDNVKKHIFLKESNKYTISYMANKPAQASHEPTGTMADSTGVVIDEGFPIPSSDYNLIGYEFRNWCTTADNSGRNFEAGEQLRNDNFQYGKNVKLYAQWSPKDYLIELDPGEGTVLSGRTMNWTAYYDTPQALPQFDRFFSAPANKKFIGWSTGAFGSLFKDQTQFVNLCSVTENGDLRAYKLTAQYVDESDTIIVLTKDHEPITGKASSLKLVLVDGGTTIEGFEETAAGVYTIPNGSVADGSYDIQLDGYKTSRVRADVHEGVSSVYNVNYYTISVIPDEGLKANIKCEGEWEATSSIVVPEGETVVFNAERDNSEYPGVDYDRWQIMSGSCADLDGTQPGYFVTNPLNVKIDNTLTLFAAAKVGTYDIKFFANKPAGSGIILEGEMGDQTVEYGVETQINQNKFAIKGYRFDGWNTSRDGSGTDYDDCATIKDLGDNDHQTVHLYAKWKKIHNAKPAMMAYGKAYKTSQTIGWTKVDGADGYDIYFGQCGKSMKLTKSLSASKTTYKRSGLKKKGHYRYVVKAYKKVDGKKKYLESSPMIHLANKKNKYSNVTAIKSSISKTSLALGNTTSIKATIAKKSSKKSILWKHHTETKIRYISTDSDVATVNSSGKITAKGQGSCYVYAIAPSGVYNKHKITVNK